MLINLLISALTVLPFGKTMDYMTQRNKLIAKEREMALGSNIVLNDAEEAVNVKLMDAKQKEMIKGFKQPESYAPAMHFFASRKIIKKSKVFKFIQKMPKGASLHMHLKSAVSASWLIKNLTLQQGLFMCDRLSQQNILEFKWSLEQPDDSCYKSVEYSRKQNPQQLEKSLKKFISVVVDVKKEQINKVYPDINTVWEKFQAVFKTLESLLSYRPAFEAYIYQTFKEFYNDNVLYVEYRNSITTLVDIHGKAIDKIETVAVMEEVLRRFKIDHKEFIGFKIIYAPFRGHGDEKVEKNLEFYKKVKAKYPHIVIGFDMVGQEDLGRPLSDYATKFVNMKNTTYYFHAGETNWNGMDTDLNLFDAAILHSGRIGHGYAITKHPVIMREVKARNISIEICPISNQVLKLVSDIRNHPAAVLFAQGYPVVVCSDDPGLWGAEGLSYDIYLAFMGIAGAHADLRTLKQLAINSIQYSGMSKDEKKKAFAMWQAQWDDFIEYYISGSMV